MSGTAGEPSTWRDSGGPPLVDARNALIAWIWDSKGVLDPELKRLMVAYESAAAASPAVREAATVHVRSLMALRLEVPFEVWRDVWAKWEVLAAALAAEGERP